MSVAQLDDKTEIWELTDKQRVVVNALAEYPDKGPTEIAEIASEGLDGGTVSRSYVAPIKEKYASLIEQQREIMDNERFEGQEKTEGDPFEGVLDADNSAWQTFDERPVKDTPDTTERTEERTETIQVDLTRHDVEELLSGSVSDELKRELVVELVARAFE